MTTASSSPPPAASRRRPLVEALHLVALGGFALAQPIYALLVREPAFLVAHRAGLADLLAFVALLSILAPLAVAALPLLARVLGEGWRRAVQDVLVAALGAAILLPAWKRLPELVPLGLDSRLRLAIVLGATLVSAAVVAVAYRRRAAVRSFATLLTPAALVFPLVFLLHPEIRRLTSSADPVVPTAPVASTTPVVWVIFDALPVVSLMSADGSIDGARFPHFARLAAESAWFRDTRTVATSTTFAVPALLSGRRPEPRSQPTRADYPHNLFTWLAPPAITGASAGAYEVHAIEPITRLAAEEDAAATPRLATRLRALGSDLSVLYQHWLYPPELATSLPPIADRWRDFDADAVADAVGDDEDFRRQDVKLQMFEDFLAAIGSDDARTLHFGHFLWPHAPYQFLPSGRFYETRAVRLPTVRDADEWAVVLDHQRHLLQAGFVDHLLGRLLDRLDATGLAERAILVVVADHGVAFQASLPRRELDIRNRAEILRVPLFVRAPGRLAPGVRDTPAETIDVLPTVADLLGVELPFAVDGVSLLAADRPPLESPVPEAEVAAAVARKELRFGGGSAVEVGAGSADPFHRYWSPALHRRHLGRPAGELARLPVATDGASVLLDEPGRYRRVDPAGRYVPSLVTGWVGGAGDEPVELAVAVNDRLEAFTLTTAPLRQGESQRFQAMVRGEAFDRRENAVEVFRVESRPGGELALRPFTDRPPPEPFVGPRLGLDRLPGVRQAGFHDPETGPGGERFVWTTAEARLVVPFHGLRQPTGLRLVVVNTAPGGSDLTVTVGRRVVFSGHVPEGGMDRTFPLPRQRAQRPIRIALDTTTFVPPPQPGVLHDDRELGIALTGLWLLPADAGPESPPAP